MLPLRRLVMAGEDDGGDLETIPVAATLVIVEHQSSLQTRIVNCLVLRWSAILVTLAAAGDLDDGD